MTLTVALENYTGSVITNAESTDQANFDSTIGGVSPQNEADIYLQGNQGISFKVSGKSGLCYYDVGAGNELDFDTGGNQEGELLYMFISITTIGGLETIANNGLAIFIGSSTSNYDYWTIAGSDDFRNFRKGKGGFVCFAIDPRVDYTGQGGTGLTLSSARYFGVYIDMVGSAKSENLIFDTIFTAKGIRLTGSDTDGWGDMVDYCTDYSNRAWGVVDYDDSKSLIYLKGKIWVGDSTQTAVTSLQDNNRKFKFIHYEYYTGSVWSPMVQDDYGGIVVEDAVSYTTTFDDGILVGSNNGRNGSVFEGDDSLDISIDLYGGNNSSSLTRLYSTQFIKCSGEITWGNDSDHLFYGGVVDQCGQFNPVGAVKIRNCTFSNTVDSFSGGNKNGSALLWNSNIDIQDCSFIANADVTYNPHAIQHDVATTVSYNNLIFSGNDYDIQNNEESNVCDSYSESNQSSSVAIAGGGFWSTAVGQSFNGNGETLLNCKLYLKKNGSPTGNLTVKLYAHTGTYGSTGIPTGTALDTSTRILDVEDLTSSYVLYQFEFEGEYTLVTDTKYFIVAEFSGGGMGDYVDFGIDNTSPTHGGNLATYLSSWSYNASTDGCFYIYSGTILKINASNGANPGTAEETGSNPSATKIVNAVNINVYVKDSSGSAIQYAYVGVFKDSDDSQLMNEETNSSGLATEAYNYTGDVDIYYRIRKSSSGDPTRYIPFDGIGTIGSGGFEVTVILYKDTNIG